MGPLSKVAIAILAVAGLAYYWLLVDSGPASIPPRTFDMAAVRRAADAFPGDKPTAIHFALVASREVPSAALAAGTGFRPTTAGVIAWKIEAPGGSIVIDPGLSRADALATGFNDYDPAAAALVERWIDEAGLILLTHAHLDHVGLFLDHPRFDGIMGKAILTPGMLATINALYRENGSHIKGTRSLAPIEAIAPGVVLIQTPGHTPASEMIFVKLANGREFLFAGDTASLAFNIEKAVPRSRLLTDFLVQEDRHAVIGWVKALHALEKKEPRLVILPSHDADWIGDAAAAEKGFSIAPDLAPKAPPAAAASSPPLGHRPELTLAKPLQPA